MRITVLDSDFDQAALICDALGALGHSCSRPRSSKLALEELRRDPSDLLVAAWPLRDTTWQEMDAALRDIARIPVLAVVGRNEDQDAVSALTAGIDDYIVAPLRRGELQLRARALLKLAHPGAASEQFRAGRYVFDPDSSRAWAGGEEVSLTRKEFAVALLFFRNLNRPLSRVYIQESVWPQEEEMPSRTIDTHVSRVRTKLGLIPENGYRLMPVYSFGYRLEQLAK